MKTFIIGTLGYVVTWFLMWCFLPKEVPWLVWIITFAVVVIIWGFYCYHHRLHK